MILSLHNKTVENLIINVASRRMDNTELSKWLQENTVQTENL